MSVIATMDGRNREVRRNVEVIFERIRNACERVRRDPEGVTVVAVSKRFSLEDVRLGYQSGIRHFGENRVQELVEKVDGWRAAYPDDEVDWHMVGHLQRNKARDVIGRCTLFHGLDSHRLAETLDARAGQANVTIPCLVQVNVSREASKFGFEPEEVEEAVRDLLKYENLEVRGLMTLARPVDDPEEVRPEFAKLASLLKRIQQGCRGDFDILSMGMSGDFEVAVEEGATHVRVGTAVFGARPD